MSVIACSSEVGYEYRGTGTDFWPKFEAAIAANISESGRQAQANERSVEQHYRWEFRKLFNREAFESDAAKSTWAVINELMLENVYIFRDHFIGYPPLPVYIEFADSSVVKLICGRERQMEFMLESLKKNYPRDYSANQRSREASMQRALTELMAEHFPDVLVRSNVNLRVRGKVLTDVDLAVFDPEFGDLILFQLKYQDCHGVDIKAGNSRMSRFLSESISWLEAVKQWPGTGDPGVLRNAFRLPRNAQVTRVRKLIVARHHAYPLASIALDDDVAFGTWMQLFNACEVMRASQGGIRSIKGLFALLRRHVVGAEVRFHQRERPSCYKLGEVEFEVVQLRDTKAG